VRAKKKPTWQFLWWHASDYGKDRRIKERFYVANTIEQACDKMLKWIEGRRFDVAIDCEARAEHVRYNQKRHRDKFPDLLRLDHQIREYVN
jgi:hypothetical protein